MTTTPPPTLETNNDHIDDGVVESIVSAVLGDPPRSFFLFAGAGSGKTHTLKEVLLRLTGQVENHIAGKSYAEELRRKRRKLAVITYTNNAANEIAARLALNPLVDVSTIHSFCWRLIEGFDPDIQTALLAAVDEKLRMHEEARPKDTPTSGKPPSARESQRIRKWGSDLASLQEQREKLEKTKRFTYSPDQKRFGKGALTHAQVIDVAVWLLTYRPTLQQILVDRYPIIFIDESQDTTKKILKVLLPSETQNTQQVADLSWRGTRPCLGLIGDYRQRIYLDGERSLSQQIPEGWFRPVLRLNRRCPPRVVKLINDIWEARIEGRTEQANARDVQVALSLESRAKAAKGRTARNSKDDPSRSPPSPPEGAVHLFVGQGRETNKPSAERRCAEKMADITGDPAWRNHNGGYKVLVLEHQLAADRAQFGPLYRSLHAYDKERAKTGDFPMLGVLEEVFLPLDEVRQRPATQASFHAYDLFKDRAPLLDPVRDRRQTPEAQRAAFQKAELAVKGLLNLWDVREPDGKTGGPTITDLLTFASETGLLDLHPGLPDALASEAPVGMEEASKEEEPTPDEDKTPTATLAEALRQPWSAYRSYLHYVAGLGTHATHQGVKGSEFDRVLVVIDDKAAGGNLFAYEKIFGAVPLSKSDLTNEKEGKETGIDRTLRLLYVTCSRAAGSLALVFWTNSPDAVQKRAMNLGWFDAKEISEVPEPEAPQAASSFAAP